MVTVAATWVTEEEEAAAAAGGVGHSGGCGGCGSGPQRAVFHWINVTGERRLRFNYRANLRFDRASAPNACISAWRGVPGKRGRGGSARGEGDAQRGTKWIGKMGSEIIVMKLARLPLSAFMGVPPKGSPRRAFASRRRLLLAARCR